jgi:hypothetical protein
MTKQLKFTGLLLLVTSITFGQIQNGTITRSRSNIKANRGVAPDSTKTLVTTTNQASKILKGIVSLIKKNSGAAASTVGTINENGQVTLTIKEAGDYIMKFTGTSSPGGLAKESGAPAKGGIDVWVRKNPGGQKKEVGHTNEKGEIELKNMEVGTYDIFMK